MIPEPPRIDWGPPRLQRWLNVLRDFSVAIRPLPSDTIEISESDKGTRIDSLVAPGVGGAAAVADHPFKVVTRPKEGSETGEIEYGVILESSLYKSLKPNDKQAITGLLNADRSSGWFDLSSGGYIWLGIVFEAGEITYAGIDNSDEDEFSLDEEAWSGENGYCEDDGETPPAHQSSRKLIAYTVAGGEGEPVLTQVMSCHQLLRYVCIDGRPARYPFDHEGGYPL